jgi:hypothetical protein
MTRRLVSGKPLFEGDNEHIHHMLLARGWSQRQVALVLYAVCATFGLLAMFFTQTGTRSTGFVLFVVVVVVVIAVGNLRYHEVDELRAGVKRTVGDRRIRVANNIRVRRASRALHKANTLRELVDAVSHLLESGEFAYACMQIGHPAGGEVNERAVKAIQKQPPLLGLELRQGRIFWSWSSIGLSMEDVVDSGSFWCLRLPLATANGQWGWLNLYRAFESEPMLVDMNYLSELFRGQLSEAGERIFQTFADEPTTSGAVAMTARAGKTIG